MWLWREVEIAVLKLTRKDLMIVGLITGLFVVASSIGWLIWGEVTLIASLAMLIAVLSALGIDGRRRLRRTLAQQDRTQSHARSREFSQIESLFSLHSLLKISYPLPPMRGWSIAPDFAATIVSLVYQQRPRLVMETGPGVSTLVAAYCLKQVGHGHIISVEHEERFARRARDDIEKHGLQDVASVVHAPLKELTLKGESWLWYDTQFLEQVSSVDLLIIDGPPGSIQSMARYPAVPVLFDRLADHAVILLDDALRNDERKMVELWLEEYGCFDRESVSSEKGTVILRKVGGPGEGLR